jgi:hypothetical protein
VNKFRQSLKYFLYVLPLLCLGPGAVFPSPGSMVYLQLSNGLELSLPSQWRINSPQGPVILEASHWLDDEAPGLRLLVYRRAPLPLLSSGHLALIKASRDKFTDKLRAMLEAGHRSQTGNGWPAFDSLQGCRSWLQEDLLMIGIDYSWRQRGRLWQGESVWILSAQGNYCLAFYWREGMGDYYAAWIRQVIASVRLERGAEQFNKEILPMPR